MAKIEFDKSTREKLFRLLVKRLKDEHDVEIAPFDAADLLDYLSEVLGPYYYNRGLQDAQALVKVRADGIVEAIYEIEMPVKG
jgi:uncharacterized protein (DUF2164 family)